MTTPDLPDNATAVATMMQQQAAWPPVMTYADFFKSRMDVTKAFCETAKLYIQLSTAALALPLLFTQTIMGKDAADKGLQTTGAGAWTLAVAWLSFLLAVAFGSLYQWLVIRGMWNDLHYNKFHQAAYRGFFHSGFRNTAWVPQLNKHNRSIWYGLMLGFFYLGAVFFVIYAANRLGLPSQIAVGD
jgi:ABC-type dipeptide/oligopeptide/nickel transport system permease component